MTSLSELQNWVDQVASLTQADAVQWCNGSEEEKQGLINLQLDSGSFIELNKGTHPGCYLHRSAPTDVARVEHLTFVCTSKEDDAGPNNNWMPPAEARALMNEKFSGCMQGRTMEQPSVNSTMKKNNAATQSIRLLPTPNTTERP